MKIAIMQPYIFPYIGYFQLINAVDIFVIYDGVAFIKQGWINRNRILVNGHEHMFNIKLIVGSSSNKKINEFEILTKNDKLLRTSIQKSNKFLRSLSDNNQYTLK